VDTNLIVAVAASAVAFVTLVLTTIYRARELGERRRAERRAEISARLEGFYGPLAAHLNQVAGLYHLLSAGKPEGFKILTYLLDPYQEYRTKLGKERVVLNEFDRELLEEIIAAQQQIEDLLLAKSGLVDDEALLFAYLPEAHDSALQSSLSAAASAHFRLLRLAYNGHFVGDAARYADFTFPETFTAYLKGKMEALHAETQALAK
jgi:hypothetical protein